MLQHHAPQQNIFVFGLDEVHREQLGRIRNAGKYAFQPLLHVNDLLNRPQYRIEDLVTRAFAELHGFPDVVHGVTGYWDFPTSDLIPIVARAFDLPGPSLESVLTCEHKYLSRVEQRAVVPDMVPDFQLLDPFDPDTEDQLQLDYPFWLKPVRSHSSFLGFKVRDPDDLRHALGRIRTENIAGPPFGKLLERADLPAEAMAAGGTACIAEQLIGGHQCTVEGYAFEGEVVTIGLIDSIHGPNESSFERYQYPSRLPRAVQQRMYVAAERVIRRIGLDNSAFNIEFFWDAEDDQIWIVEINPRISQSHSEIFYLVDGAPNSQVSVNLAAGERPDMPHHEGPNAVAAKFMLRSYEDGMVTHVPDAADIATVEERFPGTHVSIDVAAGMRLSDLPWQDSYSYEMAQIYTGASSTAELLAQYDEILERLDLRVESLSRLQSRRG